MHTSDPYLNLNTLFKLVNSSNNGNNGNNCNNDVTNLMHCKYVSFFDLENDVWNVNKLQIQYNLMESSDYDVIGCESTHSTQSIYAAVPRTVKKLESSLFMSCPFLLSSMLMKRELFQHYNETVFQKECETMKSDYNFTIIHSESYTQMSQFHALLLYLTIIERNIYCIHYSKSTSSASPKTNTATLYVGRVFNHSLVETSSQTKLAHLQEHNTCDHIFFIRAKQYFEERFMRIRFFSDFCSSENCKQEYEEKCRANQLENYGPDKPLYITLNQTYTHAILLNCPIVTNLSVPPDRVLGLAFEPIPYLRLSYDFIRFAENCVGL